MKYSKVIVIFKTTENLGDHGETSTHAASFDKTDSIEKVFAMIHEYNGFEVALKIDKSDIQYEELP